MEWVRNCFKSKWKLFRGSPRLRAGYYYFAAHGTPHYPNVHNLGSRDWVSDNGYEDAPLGEWSGARKWYRGDPPALIPLPVVVGDVACITQGENPNLPSEPDSCERGGRFFPLACYSPLALLEAKTNVYDCAFAYQMAEILRIQYSGVEAARILLDLFFDAQAVVTAFPQPDASIPNCLVATISNLCLVMVTGTTNFQQLALQSLSFGLGPTNQGYYSASSLYDRAANVMAANLGSVGGGDASRFVLIGHSYGAAICQVLATKVRLATPTRRVELVTYGCPKPGDDRLRDINAPMRQINWVNEGDPVPYLPPRGATFFELFALIPSLLFKQWLRYERPAALTVLKHDGTIDYTNGVAVPDDLLTTTSVTIAAGLEPEPFESHSMAAYRSRIRRICRHVCGGIDQPAQQYRLTYTGVHFDAWPSSPLEDYLIVVTQEGLDPLTWTGEGEDISGNIFTSAADEPDPIFVLQFAVTYRPDHTEGWLGQIHMDEDWWIGFEQDDMVIVASDNTPIGTVAHVSVQPVTT